MRIVVEVTHPAHVHFFRNPVRILQEQGHEVLITSRQKDGTIALLEEMNIPHSCLTSESTGSVAAMLKELIRRNIALTRILKRFNADVVAGVGGTSAAHAGVLCNRRSVVFYNTEEATLQNYITYPFATQIIVSTSYTGWTPRRRTNSYRGYHELSYLHPRYFQPDLSKAVANGLAEQGDTFILRLVSWRANHDIGLKGWDEQTLDAIVRYLRSLGRVIISSERELPAKHESLRYAGKQSALHHLMAHCRLIVGESATMASEAVAMGVPAIYAAPSYRGYISEQQDRYALAHYIRDPKQDTLLAAVDEFLSISRNELKQRHARLVDDCVDVAQMVADTLTEAAE